MDIWIIQDGEKIGPIHDFNVRQKIANGELPRDTPAWHDGLPAWKPLVEISLFEREFDAPIEAPVSPWSEDQVSSAPPPLPAAPVLIRRFWARWFDLYLFAGIWWIVIWATKQDVGATLMNPWIILCQYIPWFALETFLLHRFGTTPGKWLLGLRVVNEDASHLTLTEATRRSARVLCIGLGFGWGLLALACQIMAYFTAKRLGRPLWDHAGAHRVIAAPLHPVRLAAFVILLFLSIQLQMLVVSPYVLDAASKTFPSLKQQLEANPPWHLPPRS